MTAAPLSGVLDHLRTLAVDDFTDQQLVERFAGTSDHAAFAALVRRYGPLVLGVCRRILGAGPDLDDVFQATFVVLAQKACTIRKQTAVASWLYGVAYRLSLKVRARRGRRQRRESVLSSSLEATSMHVNPTARASLSELGALLDEELQRLPAACRDALLLCHMQGLSNTEAARQLGWPLGTLKGRVQRGRNLLRQRLELRGVSLSATALVLALAEQARAIVPAELTRATVACASPAAVARRVAALAEGALQGLAATKVKLAVVAGFMVGVVAIVSGTLLFQVAGVCGAPTSPVAEAEQEKQTQPVLDAVGDPLPPGATARLGTIRWRHGSPVNFLFLSPDGKSVVSTANDRWIRVWDAATGKEVHRFGPGPQNDNGLAPFMTPTPIIPRPSQVAVAVSSDGKLVAGHFDGPTIQLWNIATGKKADSIDLGDVNFEVGALAFSPDGKHLAIARVNGPVRLWDLETGKRARDVGRASKQNVQVLVSRQTCLAYSLDGKTLVTVLSEFDTHHIQFWDPNLGKEMRSFEYENRLGVTSPVFSRDGKLFAFASTDGEVCLLEANTAQLLYKWKSTTMPGGPSLVFSADGTRLYSKGAVEGSVRQGDVATGKELPQVGAVASTSVMRNSGPLGCCLVLSSDGKTLATGGRGNDIRFLDVASGKERLGPSGHTYNIVGLGYAPDGKSVVTSAADRMVRWWEASTGKPVQVTAVPGGYFNFTASQDGRFVAYENEGGAITLLEAPTAKVVGKIAAQANDLAPTLLFAPDCATLLVKGLQAKEAVLHDVPSGKERCRVPVPTSAPYASPPASLFFSPDGKLLAVNAAPGSLALHSVATGKAIQKVTFSEAIRVNSGALSPDGRTVALDQGDGTVCVVELATGQERRRYGKKHNPKSSAAAPDGMMAIAYVGVQAGPGTIQFSPDSRLLAHASPDRALHVWDVATGQALARFEGHQAAIGSVAFAPDSASVVTASSDTTALVWDIKALRAKIGPVPRALAADAVKALWADLASDKADVAFVAITALAAAPMQAVPLLKQQIPPATTVDVKRIEQLIDQLDNSEFKVRQEAQAELLKIGEQVVPYVEKVLAGKVTLEIRQRLEGLHGKLKATVWTGDRLRVVRGVEVLERIGNSNARQALQALAEGAPGSLVTVQAAEAIHRLK
jgi:RNA polymerase sigma factor (sigma-70 family)